MAKLSVVGSVMLLLLMAEAQQRTAPEASKAGIISGSVFAITKGGDLKPARLASVYVLYIDQGVTVAKSEPEDLNSAGLTWMDKHHIANVQYLKEAQADGMNWSDWVMCHKNLLTYQEALSQTLDWLKTNPRKQWQILSADADENGVFEIAVPHPGEYMIVATGQAGVNDAFWQTDILDPVLVNAGATTRVKLSSPAKFCLKEASD